MQLKAKTSGLVYPLAYCRS